MFKRLLAGLLAVAVLAVLLVVLLSGGAKHPPYHTFARPPLGQLKAPGDCSRLSEKQHVLGACLPHPRASTRPPAAASGGIYGPDVSNNDPQSCAAIHAMPGNGQRFLYLKSTEGTGFTDSTAAYQAACAKAAGLPVGGYDFQHVCGVDAGAEAAHFVNALRAQGLLGPGTMPPAADAEYGSGSCGGRAWMETWVNDVKTWSGRTPIVYTGAWWWQPNMGGYWPQNLQSWISGYGVSYPYMPSGRSQLDFWQFTDHGAYGDESVYRDGEAAFRALTNQAPPDPHHYGWFYTGPFGGVSERERVQAYDELSKNQAYERQRAYVRGQLRWLADRLWTVNHRNGWNWNKYNAGWREHQLRARGYDLKLCANN